MRRLFLLFMILAPLISKSQDLVIMRNGDTVNCKIIKVDSLNVYYNFQKGDRTIGSFIAKNELRSYHYSDKPDSIESPNNISKQNQDKYVIIDTSVFVKPSYKWINLITYSQKYGINATGWSVQYYGYVLKHNSIWMIPCVLGIEGFTISPHYFSQSKYQSARIGYYMAGISPFRKLNDYFFLNLGLQIMFGTEQLKGFSYNEITNTIFGIAPSQGLYFIPKSKFGIVCGIGLYEKLLNSEVYKNDLGAKFEIGIKF